jgi:hypothetical protein
VAASRIAGFTEDEVLGSPLGVLQEDFILGEFGHFRVGSRALIGMNGCTLLEVTHR